MGVGRRGDFETKYIDEKFSKKQRIIETQGLNKRWNNGLASPKLIPFFFLTFLTSAFSSLFSYITILYSPFYLSANDNPMK